MAIDSKILLVKDETAQAGWNKHLPVPLREKEKVIVSDDQTKVEKGYIRVRHGRLPNGDKAESVFSAYRFKTISGKEVKC